MRPPRVGNQWRLAAARIAAGLAFHVENQKVVDTGLGQPPGGRQPGDAAADDQHASPARFGWRRELAVAQTMAERLIHAEQFAGRQRRLSGRSAPGQGGRPHRAEKVAAAGTRRL
jgi:hypothetical protein